MSRVIVNSKLGKIGASSKNDHEFTPLSNARPEMRFLGAQGIGAYDLLTTNSNLLALHSL